jgi:hypothetical protein
MRIGSPYLSEQVGEPTLADINLASPAVRASMPIGGTADLSVERNLRIDFPHPRRILVLRV